ncbi:BREX system P-loop protein BrxC [Weissella paramesenteroides]|uniref:BREX system P-loop protein BrxC n=1 Tax=Weissella paramesenteroides TaxID=1249 RepID=UPI0038573759
MKIQDIFEKDITRDIQGVIKVGQDDVQTIKQDLDEYVVTSELQRYFADFFDAYQKGINGTTDKMGVWISGFFGSGKSHFLKILSYLLNSQVRVDGMSAVEFFKQQNKVADPMTIANMDLAASVPSDVILFNIDSESKSGNKSSENAIRNVFLQVFNKMQGFTDKNFWLADMEQMLVADGLYDDFKAAYKGLNPKHDDWEKGRDRYAFEAKIAIEPALKQVGYQYDMPNFSADYELNIKDFAERVAAYINARGDNHHVVFLVDEVGQFIGDDIKRMLNLQTIVEELGVATGGKAWVIVTSQQAIDEVTTNLSGTDFSKIQGRFDTKISMSSADVAEVIKKRLLAKTNDAAGLLEGEFENNKQAILNKFNFGSERKWRKYKSAQDYTDVYPFVPYQFELLQSVLTAVREHGSDGKHLSEGERSMLAIFKESAEKVGEDDTSTLIPFSSFYDGLEGFIDHEHRIVISNAEKNEAVNPNEEKNPFALRVLQTLFMVKHVDSFEKNIDGITTLLISSNDEDVIELRKRVEDALNVLIKQGFVEKTTKGYEFLTNTEQDIKRQIDKQMVNDSDVDKSLGDFLFAEMPTTFTPDGMGKNYNFKFNTFVDEYLQGSNRNALNMKVITPLNDMNNVDVKLEIESTEAHTLVIDLPNNAEYIDELRQAIRIAQYLSRSSSLDSKASQLISVQSEERKSLMDAAKKHALDALSEARVFVNGNQIEGSVIKTRLESGMKNVVGNTFRKLNDLVQTHTDRDIVSLFASDDGMVLNAADVNQNALEDVKNKIAKELTKNPKVSLETIISQFQAIPYGFSPIDTQWLVAKLFVDGKIDIEGDGEKIFVKDEHYSNKQKADLFLKNQKRLALTIKQDIPMKQRKALKNLAKEVFGKRAFQDETDDGMVLELRDATIKYEYDRLSDYEGRNSKFPGHVELQMGIQLLKRLLGVKDTAEFYAQMSSMEEELLDWHEAMEDKDVKDFYGNKSSQAIWEQGIKNVVIYHRSEGFITNVELNELVDNLESLIKSGTAKKVQEVKAKNEEFSNLFNSVLDDEQQRVILRVQGYQERGETLISETDLSDSTKLLLTSDYISEMENIRSQATKAVDLETLNGKLPLASSKLNQLMAKVQSEVAKQQVPPVTNQDEDEGISRPAEPVKIPRFESLRDYTGTTSWHITSESDLDEQLAELKQRVLAQLNDGKTSFIDLNI